MGIHEPTTNGEKVKNTLIWIGADGEIKERYQKLHLFDVEIEGGPVLRESKYVGSDVHPRASQHSDWVADNMAGVSRKATRSSRHSTHLLAA